MELLLYALITMNGLRSFAMKRRKLQAAYRRVCVGYSACRQHIDSGPLAKPIIDIAVAVDNFEAAAICIQPLEALGYHYRGE